MKSYIWDTGALSLYFANHKETKQMMDKCLNSEISGYVPLIILSEFYYLQWRQFGARVSKMRVESMMNSNLITLELKKESVFKIGELKVKYPKLSLADSVLVGLSLEYNHKIITTEKFITEIKGVKAIKITY